MPRRKITSHPSSVGSARKSGHGKGKHSADSTPRGDSQKQNRRSIQSSQSMRLKPGRQPKSAEDQRDAKLKSLHEGAEEETHEDEAEFDFVAKEQESPEAVPYFLQGNMEYNTPDNLVKRRRLKKDPVVVESIKRFWNAYEKDSKNHISKEQYIRVNMCINKALIPNISMIESRRVAIEDWENDTRGSDTMDYRQFTDSIFEIADLWCDSIDAEDYARFLRKLFRRITVKIVTMADGSVKELIARDRVDEDNSPKLSLPEGALKYRYAWANHSAIERDHELEIQALGGVVPNSEVDDSDHEPNVSKVLDMESKAHDASLPTLAEEQPYEAADAGEVLGSETSQVVEEKRGGSPQPKRRISRAEARRESRSEASNAMNVSRNETNFDGETELSTEDGFSRVNIPPIIETQASFAPDAMETWNAVKSAGISKVSQFTSFLRSVSGVIPIEAEHEHLDDDIRSTDLYGEQQDPGDFEGDYADDEEQGYPSGAQTPTSTSRKNTYDDLHRQLVERSPSTEGHVAFSPSRDVLSGLDVSRVSGRARAASDSRGFGRTSVKGLDSSLTNGRTSQTMTSSRASLGALPGLPNASSPTTDNGRNTRASLRERRSLHNVADVSILLRRTSITSYLLGTNPTMTPKPLELKTDFVTPKDILTFRQSVADFITPKTTSFTFMLPSEEIQEPAIAEVPFDKSEGDSTFEKNPYKRDFFDINDEEIAEAHTDSWCLLISGKPGCGKTEVAKALAEKTKMVYLNPLDLIEKAAQGKSAYSEKVIDCLANGGVITSELKGKLLEEAIDSEEVEFKGCIIDDFPMTATELRTLVGLQKPIRHIELDIPNEDAFDRINGRMIDPDTWVVHNSRALKDEVDAKNRKAQSGDDEDGKREDEPEPDEENPDGQTPIKKADPTEILSRLIGRPEDSEAAIMSSISNYQTLESDVKTLQRNLSARNIQTFKVDALQPLSDIVENIQLLLDNVPLPRLPKRLNVEDGERVDMIQNLKNAEIIEGHPRELSKFADHCPVTYMESEKLVPADPHFAADYRGKLYMFADEAKMKEFIENPHVFTKVTPGPPFMKLAVLGPPLSGKSTQATAIANKYNLVHIDVQKLVDYHVTQQTETGKEIAGLLESGQSITPEIYADIIAKATKLAEDSSGDSNGWILDGYPFTSEQATVLVERGIIPGNIVDLNPAESSLKGRWNASEKYPSTTFVDYTTKAFSESYSKMLGIFTEAGSRHNPIDCIGAMDEVTGRIMNAIDPIIPRAEEIDFASLLPADRRYGDTGNYCPVALKDFNSLIAGKEDLAAIYKGGIYLFSDEESKRKFIANPSNYITGEPKAPPSVKVLIQGTEGSNKVSIAKKISAETGVPYVTIEELLNHKEDSLKSADAPLLPRDDDGKITDQAVANTVCEALNLEPYKSDGMILVGIPTVTVGLLEAMEKLHIVPEKIISLQTNADNEVKRVFKPARLEDVTKVVDKEREAIKKEQAAENGEENEDENTPEKKKQDEEDRRQAIQDKKQSMDDEAKENITKKHDEYAQAAESVEAYANERNVSVINIDANEREPTVLMNVKNGLKKIVGGPRQSLFSVPVAVSPEIARQLIDSGTKRLSKFGRYDPVQLFKEREFATQVPNENARYSSYRHHIYMFHNDENQKEFQNDPLQYLNQVYRPPFVRPQLIVLGQPKSGKSTLTQNLAKDTGAVYLNMPSVLTYAAKQPTRLGKEIRYCLNRGAPLSDELCVKGLKARLNARDCIEKGWVLDGYPMTEYQQALMQQERIIPTKVFQLDLPENLIYHRANLDRKQYKRNEPRLDSGDILQAQLDIYKRHSTPIFRTYNRYGLVQKMDAGLSKWSLRTNALSVVGKSLRHRQDYLMAKENGRPACVYDTGLSLEDVNQKLSPFGDYCPVSYVSRGELIKCPNELEHVVEYKDAYYKCASSNEVTAFVIHPNAYTKYTLPPNLPRRLSPEEIAEVDQSNLGFKGYCPVTFATQFVPNSASYNGLVEGNRACMVAYANRIFSLVDERALEMFMKSPWKYAAAKLPKKLPPKKTEINLFELPTLGYFEQTVAHSLIDSLTDLGEKRPVYPGKGITESALKYIAIHLKAHNHKNKPHLAEKYSQKLDAYVEKCQLANRVAQEMKRDLNSPRTLQLAKEYVDAKSVDLHKFIR